MKALTKLIKKYKFINLKPIKFNFEDININYKSLVNKIIKNIKKINNLIIASYNQDFNMFFTQHIFNCYVARYNCSPTYYEYKFLLKKAKCNKFELQYSYEIYSYNLLKYITKSKDYCCFTQLLIRKVIIKSFKKVTQKTTENQEDAIGFLANKSIFAFFCKNGCNYIKVNKQDFTKFSANLCKQNNIEILVDDINLMQKSKYYFYKNHVKLINKFTIIEIHLLNNKLEFNINLIQNKKIKILLDKNLACKKTDNKFFISNNSINCVFAAKEVNCLTENNNYIGFILNSEKTKSIKLSFENCSGLRIKNSQYVQIKQELFKFYSCANNYINTNNILKICEYNVNLPIKLLNNLSFLGFSQCEEIKDLNKKMVIDDLNFNQKLTIPNNIYYHLLSDGKVFTSLNVNNNKQLILLHNCSFLCLDIQSYNFYYKKYGKNIKISLPTLLNPMYINCQENIISLKKCYNFLIIQFAKAINQLLSISNNKETVKSNNIFKYFLSFNREAKNMFILDLKNIYLNKTLLFKRINNLNIFSQDFAILHQKINKKCDFLPIFNAFNRKNEIINLFLSYSNWQLNYEMILEYVYSLRDYNFQYLLNDNLNMIYNNCFDLKLKDYLVDQIGQLYQTPIDYAFNGNFAILKNIDDFYYCFIYITLFNKIVFNNSINLLNKQYLLSFSQIEIVNEEESILYEIKPKSASIQFNNISYVGFSDLCCENNKHIIYL